MATDRRIPPLAAFTAPPHVRAAFSAARLLERAATRMSRGTRVLLIGLGLLGAACAWADPTVAFPPPAPAGIGDTGNSLPFATATLTASTDVSLTIRFSKDSGTFSAAPNLSSVISGSDIVYTLSTLPVGSSEAALRALVFSPVPNRIPITTTETVVFRVRATEQPSGTVSPEATVSLTVTPVNDTPSFNLSGSLATIFDNQVSTPFSSATVSDVDAGDVLTATITYPSVDGILAAGAGSPGLTLSGTAGNYHVSGSATDLQAYLRALEFNPTDNRLPVSPPSATTDITFFNVTVRDLALASDFDSISQNVRSFNDPPQIVGDPTTTPIPDTSNGSAVFTPVTIVDPDFIDVGGNLEPQPIDLVADLQVNGEGAAAGAFVGSQLVFNTSGTAEAPGPNPVTTALHTLLFDPIPNRIPVGETENRSARLTATDNLGAATTRVVSFSIVSINDSPTVVVRLKGTTVPDTGVLRPFDVTVEDPDVGETFQAEVIPISDPTASFGAFEPSGFGPYTAASADDLEGIIGALAYRPSANLAANQAVTFRLRISDVHGVHASPTSGPAVDSAVQTITILGVNDLPQIAVPASPIYRTTDDISQEILPFKGVSVSDPDNTSLTVTLSINGLTPGTFKFGALNGSSLVLTGDPATLTANLRSVTFTASPRANRRVGDTDTIRLSIAVNDGSGGTRTDQSIRVVITSVNGAPVIQNVPSLSSQPLRLDPPAPGTALRPFDFGTVVDNNKLTVTDDDGTNIVMTVKIDDPAKGHFQNLGGFAEQLAPDNSRTGVYLLKAFPADVTTALRALEFVASATYPFPPASPGGTTFTLQARDSVLNTSSKTLSIVVADEAVNWLVTSDLDDGSVGTLRWVINQIETSRAVRSFVTFNLPSYPAVIRLEQGAIALRRNVAFRGPGADLLTISGDIQGDGIPDVQLFRVEAAAEMDSLTLAHGAALSGTAITGGAAYVGPGAQLRLVSCIVRDSIALQWGGGVDVDGGSLVLEHCLVRGNRTEAALGLGGAGVALYTDEACAFRNTTFSGNAQQAANGIGGGALYIENESPITALGVEVLHCTFAENSDARPAGATALFANVFGTGVRVKNSIFADGQTRNLEAVGAASIHSEGGNLSDDRTRTVLTQNGQPKVVFLLNHTSDQTNVSGLLSLPLDELLHPLPGYRLPRTSRAVGAAELPASPVDQTGAWRDSDPDSGALERGAGPELILNEIGFGAPAALPQFLEFYVPRDAQPTVLDGYAILVDGHPVFTFPASTRLKPGFGILVADSALTPVTCPPGTPDCPPLTPVLTLPPGDSLGLDRRGTVELVRPGGAVVLRVDYVAQFVDPEDVLNTTKFDNESATLAPQTRGAALVPHTRFAGGTTGPVGSPGGSPSPFGSPNAFPLANADAFVVDEDVATTLSVIPNDFEEDRSDRLVIVDVSSAASPLTENDATATTALGGQVAIVPSSSPLRGTSVRYDPQGSAILRALPVGFETVDSFTYTIVDIGAGEIEALTSSDGGATVTLQISGHRLTNGESILVSGFVTASYNGTFAVTVVDDDHVKLSTAFLTAPVEAGQWQTVNPRSPTARSQALVSVTVLGANDAPVVGADTVPATDVNEDTPVRIMAGPSLVGIATNFDTDDEYPSKPRVSPTTTLLGGRVADAAGQDVDPDTGETASLRVVGVVSTVHAIAGFSASTDSGEAVVESPGHGLSDGTVVLLSGYSGYHGYNGFQSIVVVDADHFRIPVLFVDNVAGAVAPTRGVWAILNDGNRLQATTALGASVHLEIRVDPLETSVVYDPTPSATLNALAVTDPPMADTFYYAVADSHGAVSLGPVTLQVAGVNDAPVPHSDPGGLEGIAGLVPPGGTLPSTLGSLGIAYYIPAGSGLSDRLDVELLTTAAPPARILLSDVFATDEEHAIDVTSADLVANDTDVDNSDTLRIRAVEAVSRGGASVSLLPNGNVHYDPVPSARLQKLSREEAYLDTFTVTVTDDRTGDVTSLVAVLVVGINDTPVAENDLATTNEDTPVTINPLLNDTDRDQDGQAPDNVLRLVPETKTTPLGAHVTVGPDSFTYDPRTSAFLNGLAVGQTATENVPTTTMDGSFVFANDDHYEVVADGSGFVLEVGTNDRNLTGVGHPVVNYSGVANQSPVQVSAPAHGLASGMLVDISGYGGSGLYNRVHRIEVLDANTFTIPVAYQDNAAAKGQWSRLRIISVSAGSRDGSLAIGANGSTITYSPAVNFVGEEVFAYSLADELGNTDSAVVRVRVVVNQLNGHLQANPDNFTVARGQAPSLDVLANDNIVPAPGQNLIITRITRPPVVRSGIAVPRDGVEIVGNQIRYLQTFNGAPGDFPYEVVFAYEVSGGGTARAEAEVVVRVVDRGNTLPTRGDAYAVLAASIDNPLAVLDNDRVLPGSSEPLAVAEIVQPPAHGTARPSDDHLTVLYTPAAGFIGEDTFTYRATDNLGGTGLAAVTVAVGGLRTSSDFFAVPFNGAPVELDVLANDPILGSPNVSLHLVAVQPAPGGGPSVGTMALQAPDALRLVFTPTPGASGEQQFIYTVADQGTPPRQAQGRVIVIVAQESVRASSDFFGVAAGSSLNALAVVANDVAIPDRGRPLTIVSVGTGLDAPNRGGTVTINAARTGLLYTPANGFVGEETFTYIVTDSRHSDTAKVVVSVGTGQLAANADAFMVFFDPQGTRQFDLAVLANDRLLPSGGQLLAITGVGIDDANGSNAPTEHGEVSIAPGGGSLTYIASPSAVPPYTERFTYEISDGTERRAQAEVLVRVENRLGARALETNDDRFTVGRDSTANVLAVLANDGVKPAGTADWTVTSVNTPTWGATAAPNGKTVLFTPAPGFVGTSVFSYNVSDGIGGTATAFVSVKVGDLVLSPDAFAALSSSTANVLDVLANDAIQPETSAADYHLVTARSADHGGQLSVVGGVVLYQPAAAAAYPYVETFEYVVADDSGLEVTQQAYVEVHAAGSDRDGSLVQMTITGVNDPPTLLIPAPGEFTMTDKQTLAPFTGVTIADVDNQGAEILEVRVVLNDPAAGLFTNLGGFAETPYGSGAWVFQGNGAQATTAIRGLVFVPTENYVTVPQTWDFTFDVLVTDPYVNQPTAGDVVVHVQAINDAPVIAGTVPNQPVYYLGSIRPFASVLLTEVDDRTLQRLTVTVSFNATRGTLSSTTGFVNTAPGVYVFQGTAAAATEALRQIVFSPTTGNRLVVDLTPPPAGELTVFTLTVNDGFAAPVVDTNTSVIAYHSLITKVFASDPLKADQFGWAVGASRDLIASGAPRDNGVARDSGAAYVRARNAGGSGNWGQVARLIATDPVIDARFGHSVSVFGETVAIGSPYAKTANRQQGSAYIFEPSAPGANDWQAQGVKVSANDGAIADEFGAAVSLNGSFLAVGAPLDDDRGLSSGGVYIFRRTAARTWAQVAKIVPADGAADDRFGYALSLSGDLLAIGAPSDADNGRDSGSVYVYRRTAADGSAWALVKKITPRLANGSTDGAMGDFFGQAVALDGGTLVVGMPKDDDVGNDRGSACIFSQNRGGTDNWGQVIKLAPNRTQNTDQFGFSVTVDDDLVVVGMPFDGESNQSRWGSVWAYGRNQGGSEAWGLVEKLDPPDNTNNDEFGRSVAIACGTLAVGARMDDTVALNAGATYIYDLAYVKPPRAATPLPAQVAVVGEAFSFTVPAATFGDPDVGDAYTLSVVGPGGAALPAWLTFNATNGTLSGTPAAANVGSLVLTVRATDSCGGTASTTLTLNVLLTRPPVRPPAGAPLTYEQWIARLLPARILNNPSLEASVWGRLANPDGDLFLNLEEYAFGTRLFENSPDDGPGLSIAVATGDRIAVTYHRRTNDPSLHFILEFSPDLTTWTDAATLPKQEQIVAIGYDLQSVTCLLPANQLPTQLFLRVRISAP